MFAPIVNVNESGVYHFTTSKIAILVVDESWWLCIKIAKFIASAAKNMGGVFKMGKTKHDEYHAHIFTSEMRKFIRADLDCKTDNVIFD